MTFGLVRLPGPTDPARGGRARNRTGVGKRNAVRRSDLHPL